MGATPKRKLHRKWQRRSHQMEKITQSWGGFTTCPDTGRPIRMHTVSPYTGKYKGKQVVAIKKD